MIYPPLYSCHMVKIDGTGERGKILGDLLVHEVRLITMY